VVKWYNFRFHSTHCLHTSLWKTISRGMWSCWPNPYSSNFHLHSMLQDSVCSCQVEVFKFSVQVICDLSLYSLSNTILMYSIRSHIGKNSNVRYKISFWKKKIVKLHKLLPWHFYVKYLMMTHKSQNIQRLL